MGEQGGRDAVEDPRGPKLGGGRAPVGTSLGVSRFAWPDAAPPFLAASEVGEHVRRAARDALGGAGPVAPALVHVDCRTGNLLREGDKVAAVLDSVGASCGDPGIAVGRATRAVPVRCPRGGRHVPGNVRGGVGAPSAPPRPVGAGRRDAGPHPSRGGWVVEWVGLGAVRSSEAEAWALLERVVDKTAYWSG